MTSAFVIGKRKRCQFQDLCTGTISLLLGISVITISILLLLQSLCKHRGESGPDYAKIYANPFLSSNWKKSSITAIIVSSFGIFLGSVQILTSLILLYLSHTRFRILGIVTWLGCHMIIFILNIICFSLAISTRTHEHKGDAPQFWAHYQFRSFTIHNLEGHLYCSVLAVNSFFILVSILITATTLNKFLVAERPITLPSSLY